MDQPTHYLIGSRAGGEQTLGRLKLGLDSLGGR